MSKVHRRKVVFLGDTAVGKTSIFHRFDHKDFHPTHLPTILGSCLALEARRPDGKAVALSVWDTAG
jgi:Ras-related protein Rab-7A